MIIAGDIGGTKTNIALFKSGESGPESIVVLRSFPSHGYASLQAIVEEFIREHRPTVERAVERACFGVAGPVKEGRVEATNLAWSIWDRKLAETIGIEHVELINDLEATAYGIEELDQSRFYTLNEGVGWKKDGHRALISAGTGLGMSIMFWDGAHYRPLPTEGGHIDFAPRNDLEHKLLVYLREKIGGRVSYERVLSGPGLYNIYSFLRDTKEFEEPAWLTEELRAGHDNSAIVSRVALENRNEMAAKALDMFVEIYGAMAGNLALLTISTGGLYVGGGIAPKILEKLKDGTFMKAYRDKGRMSWLVESIPVCVILDDKTALYGAARRALQVGR